MWSAPEASENQPSFAHPCLINLNAHPNRIIKLVCRVNLACTLQIPHNNECHRAWIFIMYNDNAGDRQSERKRKGRETGWKYVLLIMLGVWRTTNFSWWNQNRVHKVYWEITVHNRRKQETVWEPNVSLVTPFTHYRRILARWRWNILTIYATVFPIRPNVCFLTSFILSCWAKYNRTKESHVSNKVVCPVSTAKPPSSQVSTHPTETEFHC